MDRYENNYLEDESLSGLQRNHPTTSQNVVDEAELLAAQAAAEAAATQQQQHPGDAFNNVGQGLTARFRDMMMQYWQETINSIEHDDHDFKNHQLPLARIKKVMKTDEDVRMISAEAPILFAKGCEVFITELTMRAWIHAEESKRRTLQKSDIAAALTKSDMFDFLIDVVPREEEKPKKSYSLKTESYMGASQPAQLKTPTEAEQQVNDGVNQQQVLLQKQLLQQQMLQQQMLQHQHQQHPQQSPPPQSHPQHQHQQQQQHPQTDSMPQGHMVQPQNADNNNNPHESNFEVFPNFNPPTYEDEF